MIWNPFRIFSKKKQVNEAITDKNEEYNKQAKKAQKYNTSVAGIIAGRSSERATRGTLQHAVPQKTEVSDLIKKFKELSKTAEIIIISNEHSKESIDALKKQINAVKTIGKELSSSLKALTDLPFNMVDMPQKQASLREKIDKLKQENLYLNKSETSNRLKAKKGISKDNVNKKIALNNKDITSIENQINGINDQLKSFASGEKVQELSENIKNNLIEFKREISKLETMVKSIEKGQAPKLPRKSPPTPQPRSESINIMDQAIPEGLGLQASLTPVKTPKPVRPAPPPPGTTAQKLGEALKEFVAQKNLRTLVKNIESYGVYEGSREYLLKELDFLKSDLGVISNDELPKMQETLRNSSLTKKEFLDITNTLINRIDSSLKSKTSKVEQPVVGDYTEGLKKKRDEETKETYRL